MALIPALMHAKAALLSKVQNAHLKQAAVEEGGVVEECFH